MLTLQVIGDDLIGFWLISSEDAIVSIRKEKDKFMGKLIWYLVSDNPNKNLKYDVNNPEILLRKRLIWDIDVLYGFKKEKNRFIDGKIYNVKEGNTYSGVIDLKDGKMILRGYILFEFIGKEKTWIKLTKQQVDSIISLNPVPTQYLK